MDNCKSWKGITNYSSLSDSTEFQLKTWKASDKSWVTSRNGVFRKPLDTRGQSNKKGVQDVSIKTENVKLNVQNHSENQSNTANTHNSLENLSENLYYGQSRNQTDRLDLEEYSTRLKNLAAQTALERKRDGKRVYFL